MRRLSSSRPFSLTEKNLPQSRTQSAFWEKVPKHVRYLSNWEEDLVIIDIRHRDIKEVEPRKYDLQKIIFHPPGLTYVIGRAKHSLSDYPHLMCTLKVAINSALFKVTSSIGDEVTDVINHFWRMVIWMFNRGIYRLSQVTKEDIQYLEEEWPEGGWWKLLDYDNALREVLFYACCDITIAEEIKGTSNVKRLSINTQCITNLTGLPLSPNYVPSWFIEGLSEIWGRLHENSDRRPHVAKATQANYSNFMYSINLIALLPESFDSIKFLPFPNATKVARARFPNAQGRTSNITLPDAIKIINESVKWVYDYGPMIVELAHIAREALSNAISDNVNTNHRVNAALKKGYKELALKFGISLPGVTEFNCNELGRAIDTFHVASLCLAAINHGRRRNELVGFGVPYGLYFGCVRKVQGTRDDTLIDIYIEKSIQAFASFWCNEIVSDVVKQLEALNQEFRPLGTPKKEYPKIQQESRTDKLFGKRDFTIAGFSGSLVELDFSRKSKHFFTLSGVSTNVLPGRAHPFRRIFGLLYKYRYDLFQLRALSMHYRHDSSSTTNIYLTDAPGTPPPLSVEVLYKALMNEDKDFVSVMKEVESDYFEDLINRFLHGEEIGGFFSRLVLMLMRTLSTDMTFRKASIGQQSKKLRIELENQGYRIAEKEHAICCAGVASKTAYRSNCQINGEVHPEDASPSKCDKCYHLMTTPGYRQGLIESQNELLIKAKDFTVPIAFRYAFKKEAEFLDEYIKADEQVAKENQKQLEKIYRSWNSKVASQGGSA